MKKLLITVIGAAAALGASAGTISTQQFGEETVGATTIQDLNAGGTYWSGDELTNTYEIVAVSPTPTAYSLANPPTKGLGIKTTFGNPLTLKAKTDGSATTIPASGLYFDSVVKFTVCDAGQNADMYNGAKIVMWLEQTEDESTTNLIVRAGYLSKNNGQIVSTPTNYVCTLTSGIDVDAWHRVTIKAIGDITTGDGVPGFAIYIDQMGATPTTDINCSAAKWDNTFDAELVEAAEMLNVNNALFPTLDLTSGAVSSLASVSFDGTGALTDTCFTDDGPAFAKDIVAPKASVKIGNADATEYGSLAEAVAAVNEVTSGDVKFTLSKGMTIDSTLAFASTANVVLDFAGCVLTNEAATAAISNAGILTITNSVGNGGIRSDAQGAGVALSDDGNGSLAITAGSFWGTVSLDAEGTYSISGGSFADDTDLEVEGCLAEGKSIVRNAETGLYDVVDKPTTWAGFLGEAVDGAYTIDNADDVLALQNGVLAGLATADVTFKQTANIDMTGVEGFYGIGWFKSTDEYDSLPAGAAAGANTVFAGTYDGQGYTLSNVAVVRHNYAGVFNCLEGTVRNLTVSNFYFVGSAGEQGAGIIGNAQGNALVENVTSAGTAWGWDASRGDTGHNSGGIACRAEGNATFRYCVNNATINSGARRLGGIVGFTGTTAAGSSVKILCCTNNGDVTSTYAAGKGRGVGGIIASPETANGANTVIQGCANFGTIAASNENNPAGAIVGTLQVNTNSSFTDDGGNTFLASTDMFGARGSNTRAVEGLAYAVESTINDATYLTTVKAADIAKGGTYTLLTDIAASETPVITLDDAGDSITFKLNGHSFAGSVAVDHDGVTAEAQSDEQAGTITYAAAITDQWAYRLGNPVNGAYEIDNLAELKAFQAGVAVPLTTAGKTFKLTADIALDAAWEGIGIKGGKDLVNGGTKDIPTYEAGAFSGTFDGQNHTISNFQMENGTDYGGFFNSVNGATISNLKITYKEDKLCANSSSTGGDTGATFVGVARNSTLQNLTALAGTVTTVSASKDMAGIVGYLMAGSTVESCTNELNVASLLTAKARKSGGIALITQDGTGTATIRNCKNSGTVTLANAGGQAGGIVGYVGTSTTIVDCENTAAVKVLTVMNGAALTMQGTNKGNATVLSSNVATNGLNFATVDGNVATFVADSALALNGSYKVMATGATATFAFAEAGTIAFDTALATPTFAITAAEGLTLTDATEGTVTTYTAAVPAPSGLDPASDTPSAEVTAESGDAAIAAVEVTTPTEAGSTPEAKAAYKDLFTYTAVETSTGSGVYTVTLTGIKEEVQEAVSKDAVDVLTSDEATVDVPAGLCYKVTTYTALGGAAVETKSGTSNGTAIPVAKPGTTQGFIKVELATKPLN